VSLDLEQLTAFPKVSLHDHLDGGLRPATMLDLAAEVGHELPASQPEALGRWFAESANSGSLERYLETFDQTLAVMQTRDQLRRVAREFVEDLAADGVMYGEARWAPEQHRRHGLSAAQAVEAVRDGLTDGMAACRRRGQEIVVYQLLTSIRQVAPTVEIAELALRYRRDGVVGFDLAGAERGFPPDRFLPAFQLLRQHCTYYTVHAGEADGVESIWRAVCLCGANRIGHGVALIADIDFFGGSEPRLGDLSAYIRHLGIHLEMCPSSNLQTGAVPALADHPVVTLNRLGFSVSVNCDNRLMSATTLSREFLLLAEAFDLEWADVRRLTLNAAEASFAPYERQRELVERMTGW